MVEVALASDVRRADELARTFSASLGFSKEHCGEICLVASELASNLLRHASHGRMRLSRVDSGGRTGIQIESEDNGPGIPNVEEAITDGYSTAGGLGLGLGAVNRLMDELEFYSGAQGGLHVVCQRWLRPASRVILEKVLAFGAATRSYRMLSENGDTFIIRQWNRHALVGVIDGLGHGHFAQRASQTARQYIEQHFDQSMENLFRGAGRACRATRGVVMALARFDLDRRILTLASVGNIEVRLVGNPERLKLVVRRGIIGLNAPAPVPLEHPWTPGSLLIMHSDGIRTHWDWKDFPDLQGQTPAAIAHRLLQQLGKADDDATVLVVGNAKP